MSSQHHHAGHWRDGWGGAGQSLSADSCRVKAQEKQVERVPRRRKKRGVEKRDLGRQRRWQAAPRVGAGSVSAEPPPEKSARVPDDRNNGWEEGVWRWRELTPF